MPPPRLPPYVAALIAAYTAGPIRVGNATVAEVYHDDACALLGCEGGECNCSPEVRIVSADPKPEDAIA